MVFPSINSIINTLNSYRVILPCFGILLFGCIEDQDNADRPDCLITKLIDSNSIYSFSYDRSYRLSKLEIEHDDYLCEIDYSYFIDHTILDYKIKPKIVVDNIPVYEGRRSIWINEYTLPVLMEEEGNTLSGYDNYRVRFVYDVDKLKYMVGDYGEYNGGYKKMDSIVVTLFDNAGRNISRWNQFYWFGQENDWKFGGSLDLVYTENSNPLYKLFYVSASESTASLILNFFNQNLESSFKTLTENGFLFSDCEYSFSLNNRAYPLESSLYCSDGLAPSPVLLKKVEYTYSCK